MTHMPTPLLQKSTLTLCFTPRWGLAGLAGGGELGGAPLYGIEGQNPSACLTDLKIRWQVLKDTQTESATGALKFGLARLIEQ